MALRTDGDAYIAVHADTGPYRRELGPQTEAASAAAGKRSGDRFGREFNVSLLGRLKGSRNNFLNFIGSIAQVLEQGAAKIVTGGIGLIGKGIRDLAGDFELLGGTAARGVAGVLDKVGASIQGLGAGGIDGLLVQIVALSVAMQTTVFFAGALAAGFSTLLGAATALTVTLGGALLGGLVLLGPLIAGLTLGVGTLALAFSDLSDKQKSAFDPLKALFDETRTAVSDALFKDLGSQIDTVTNALTPLRDVMVNVANATRDWFTQTLSAFAANTDLQTSLSTLGSSLPGIFTSLLTLIGGIGSSLTGLFAAASPAAQSFLDKINGVVAQFSAWVNSAEGQETVNTFLTLALDLLTQVWDIAKEVGTTLGILFEEGSSAGSTLLRTIQQIVEDFNTWLGSEEGREQLTQWFADSIVAIREVGAVVGSLIALFNELDNDDTRNAFNLILTSFRAIIDIITFVISVNNALVAFILHGSTTATDGINRIKAAFDRASGSLGDLLNSARITFDQVGAFIAALPGKISAFFGDAGNLLYSAGKNIVDGLRRGITDAANGVLNYIAGLASRIATAFRNALGIKSPSKVFAEFGRNIAEGLAIGIAESSGLVTGAMSGLTGNLNTPISSLGGGGNSTSVSNSGGMTIAEGAIVVNSPFADPRLTAISVMDALAVRGK